jgi:hypothetical protein
MNKTRAKEKLDTLLTVPELKQVAEMLGLLRGGKKVSSKPQMSPHLYPLTNVRY